MRSTAPATRSALDSATLALPRLAKSSMPAGLRLTPLLLQNTLDRAVPSQRLQEQRMTPEQGTAAGLAFSGLSSESTRGPPLPAQLGAGRSPEACPMESSYRVQQSKTRPKTPTEDQHEHSHSNDKHTYPRVGGTQNKEQ
jgi:hypothetical protein